MEVDTSETEQGYWELLAEFTMSGNIVFVRRDRKHEGSKNYGTCSFEY
jgi:hypothetical protein